MIRTVTELSASIASLCRICSAPGSHSIHVKIPPYLHEHPRECPRWKMAISKLLTEVTGVDCAEDDGLPQQICVLCISYLKHAYTFRRQAIDNVAALLAARCLVTVQNQKNVKDVDPPEVIVRPMVVRPDMNGHVPFQKNLDKEVLQQVVFHQEQQQKKQNNVDEERQHIDEMERMRYHAALQTQERTTKEAAGGANLSGFLNYREKEFQEDDVMELDVLKENNISFNLPEDYKEKKCPSCRRRFMFDETHSEHLRECLQFRLIKFIREVYHLLYLKENRSISPFEFIRRAVFKIRESVQTIASYEGSSAEPPSEEEDKLSVEPIADVQQPLKIDRSFLRNLEKLRVNYNEEGLKIPSPATVPLHQSVLDDGRSSITTASTSVSPVVVTAARCDECAVPFETITELETHNLNYHRELAAPLPPVVVANPASLLNNFCQTTFLPVPSTAAALGTSANIPRRNNIFRNRLRSVATPDSVKSTTTDDDGAGSSTSGGNSSHPFKKIRCKRCRNRFSMIAQLDEHMLRCKGKGKSPRRGQSPATPSPQNVNQQQQQRRYSGSAGVPGERPGGQSGGRSTGASPFDRNQKNLNSSYFYYMERLKDSK